jgi:hypothetical protein
MKIEKSLEFEVVKELRNYMYITDVREQPMLDRADDAERSVFLVDVTIFC